MGLENHPKALARKGFRLRPQSAHDYEFLERLYASVRAPELAALAWPEQVKRAFLADQHKLQYAHYSTHYYDAEFLILERDGVPVGRLCVFRGTDDIRIVDIALLPETRGGGVGTALITAVLKEAAAVSKTVSIHVEKFNPAKNLYRRLGFREVDESGPYWRMERRPHGG